jgi:hypothetical protein
MRIIRVKQTWPNHDLLLTILNISANINNFDRIRYLHAYNIVTAVHMTPMQICMAIMRRPAENIARKRKKT